ncbi:MAG: hypothetical protein AAGB16_04935 [Pseudomonadota bacterium]
MLIRYAVSIIGLLAVLMVAVAPASAQTKKLHIVLGSPNDGALGGINKGLGGLTNAIGSYRAYINHQDKGRVEYDGLSTFYVSKYTGSFALYEHVAFSKKRVSNVVDLSTLGREKTIYIFCMNTSKLVGDAFACEAASEAYVKRQLRKSQY